MKAFLFDYGATIDTRGEHWSKVIFRAYQRHDIPLLWESFWQAYVAAERTLGEGHTILPTDSFLITLEKKLSLQFRFLRSSLAEDYLHPDVISTLADDIYRETLEVIAESREVLQQLVDTHHPTMVLVSNFYGNIRTVLSEFRLNGFFASVIESAEVGIRKPDIRIWQLAIDALRQAAPAPLLPSDITVVGDSLEKDILPAQALGCHTIHITNGLKNFSFFNS